MPSENDLLGIQGHVGLCRKNKTKGLSFKDEGKKKKSQRVNSDF
jgi:hypothetical protein